MPQKGIDERRGSAPPLSLPSPCPHLLRGMITPQEDPRQARAPCPALSLLNCRQHVSVLYKLPQSQVHACHSLLCLQLRSHPCTPTDQSAGLGPTRCLSCWTPAWPGRVGHIPLSPSPRFSSLFGLSWLPRPGRTLRPPPAIVSDRHTPFLHPGRGLLVWMWSPLDLGHTRRGLSGSFHSIPFPALSGPFPPWQGTFWLPSHVWAGPGSPRRCRSSRPQLHRAWSVGPVSPWHRS